MGVVVELRKPGRDKRLMLLHPRTEAERLELVREAHLARCGLGLSYRQVQAYIAGHGARVGLGTAFRYVNGWTCQRCREPV